MKVTSDTEKDFIIETAIGFGLGIVFILIMKGIELCLVASAM